MGKDLSKTIIDGEIDFWEYSFRENCDVEGNDYKETCKQFRETKGIWRGMEQGIRYYGFRFENEIYFVCIDNRDKTKRYFVFNNTKKEKISLGIECDTFYDIVNNHKRDARKELIRIHRWQKAFSVNWRIMIILLVLGIILAGVKRLELNHLSYLTTIIALILALEDSYIVLAKRFQKKKNREICIAFLIGIFLNELMSAYNVFGSIFNNMINETVTNVGTIIAIITTLGVLIIRRDASSLI